ncbi:hypothetical protein ACRARG_13135 [Pseudooceanicola sp. C21-150M6]|uniref:hypothetical protein n=1 Tax=Pseudooceanicola sp. C21-150M6 TaxID=3434355 RepID=UPI003D7F40D2
MKPLLPLTGVALLAACMPETQPPPTTSAGIPEAIQGRWGLSANDCNPAMADVAKGLMVVGGTTLTFYESRGTLTALTKAESTRIEGDFSFTGEGMSWTRQMVLDVQSGGDTLIRRDYGDDAMPGPLKYTNCATL